MLYKLTPIINRIIIVCSSTVISLCTVTIVYLCFVYMSSTVVYTYMLWTPIFPSVYLVCEMRRCCGSSHHPTENVYGPMHSQSLELNLRSPSPPYPHQTCIIQRDSSVCVCLPFNLGVFPYSDYNLIVKSN